MSLQFFNPFDELLFNETTCFLTGDELTTNTQHISVFPTWFLELSETTEKRLRLMDKGLEVPYAEMKLPCSTPVKTAFDELDQRVHTAFLGGYEGMKELSHQDLFLWIGKIVYGVLYYEFHFERKMNEKLGEEFGMSEELTERLSLFHLMLQTITNPITFTGKLPWSIILVRNKYSTDIINYRDDAVNLMFSLSTKDFGLIVCLQDNGVIAETQQSILSKIGDTILHPVQFEELWSKMMYFNYLLQYKASYKFGKNANGLIIEGLPTVANEDRPLFHVWNDQTFSTVLASYWKPWALQEKDIYKEPHSPLSFLENERTGEFIDPLAIKLPF